MNRFPQFVAATLAITILAVSVPARAEPYDQGKISVSVGGSLSSSGGKPVFVIGAGAGYFVLRGLELGLSGATWFGVDPRISQITPGVRYIFWMVPVVQPYLGGFYRHWFVHAGEPDFDTVGGRTGLLINTGGPLHVGIGVVYEHVITRCSTGCGRVYPELSVSFVF